MIKLNNVTKYYKTNIGKHYVIKDANLIIPENKNVGILGRNGAGKSTFLKLLGQIDFPNKGTIESDKSFSWPMGLAGGFQGSMTGRQNVTFVCRIYGRSYQEIQDAIKFVEEFAELDEYFNMPIRTYSSGMKSRLSFGLSLAFDFDYILIDETLSVGDKIFKNKATAALKEKIKNSNVLMVSHSMPTLKEMCDVGIVLDKGEFTYYDNIEDAIEKYNKL